MTARGDSLGCSRNPGSNYYAGLAHQSMIDLDADDAARVPAFHSLWVGKAGGELLRSSPPLSGASVLSASRLEPLVPFPWHRRIGSHVPYESLVELRAAYMPDVARAVSGIPRADPGGWVSPRF